MLSTTYAILNKEKNVYISCPMFTVIRNALTLEAAINALLQTAPPDTIKTVFILSDPGFENCRRSVEAIQNAGYTNIEMVESHALLYSSIIDNVPLKQSVGTIVFVFIGSKPDASRSKSQVVTLLRKCEEGWKVVKKCEKNADTFAEFSSVGDVIVYEGTPAEITALQQYFPGRQLHLKEGHPPDFIARFMENLVQNGNLNGYAVLPYCFYDLLVQFGDKCEKIVLEDVPPFTITKEVDVGDASIVEIRAFEVNRDEKPLVKTFKFKSDAFRTVSITVNVDKTLLPQVTLKTIATRESNATTVPPPITEKIVSPSPEPDATTVPPPITEKIDPPNPEPPSIIFFVSYSSMASFVVTKFVHGKVIGETTFPTVEDTVAFMEKQTPNVSTAAVVLQYPERTTIVELQAFRQTFQTAGFTGVKFIPTDSITIALFLGSLQTSIDNGQFVAMLNASMFYIVTRRKGYLSLHEAGPLDQFNDKARGCKFIKVIVDQNYNVAMFNAVLRKFGSNVHILTDFNKSEKVLHQFLLSCVDKSAPNDYTVNDFCDFDVDIPGHELISTRFMEFPVIVYAAIDVSDWKTLEVNLVKSKTDVELLKKFKLKHGTRFVQIVVRADTTCDVTARMNVIAKLTWPRTITLSDCGFDDPFAAIEAAKKPVEKITLEAPPLSTRYDVMAMKNRHQKKNLARNDAGKNGISDEPSKAADLSTTCDIDVDKAGLTTTLPEELSQPKSNSPPTAILKPAEKPTTNHVLFSTSNDAKDKKSRSQRRKLARRNAVNSGTVAEASKSNGFAASCEADVDCVRSVRTLPKEVSQLQLDPAPTLILKFTSDNRVLIKADATYTGVKYLLAYVQLQCGKAPIVGKDAFDALQTHPDSVFYDITRLLATDFDPNFPHPLWSFKTKRGADDKLVIHGGGGVVTFPIVLFGLVVRSTLLYIQGHLNAVIAAAGIRLPWGSAISDEDLEGVSKQIGMKLVIVEDDF